MGVTTVTDHAFHVRRFLRIAVLQYRKLILTGQVKLLRIRLDHFFLLQTVEVRRSARVRRPQ